MPVHSSYGASGRGGAIAPLLVGAALLSGCGEGRSMSSTMGGSTQMDNGGNPPASPPECPGAGTWYLRVGDAREVMEIGRTPNLSGACAGLIGDEATGAIEPLEVIRATWSGLTLFRRPGSDYRQWYDVKIVDGLMVGRAAAGDGGDMAPVAPALYDTHVTGWRAETMDAALAPRVWDLFIDKNVHARLRLDRDPSSPSGFSVRYKTYGSVVRNVGESDSFDGIVDAWDGRTLRFRINVGDAAEVFRAEITGRMIEGDWRWGDDDDPAGTFTGARAEVFSHGFAPMAKEARDAWQRRVRQWLQALLMAGAPTPFSAEPTVLRRRVAPFAATASLPDRDDGDLAALPQAYHLDEVQLDLTLPDPYGGEPLPRRIHGWLATPDAPPPPEGHPVAIVLNGHEGSAYAVMSPDHELFWYGDSFARRGFVVLAVDVSHRPYSDRGGLYQNLIEGDDPSHGNGVHPAIRAADMDSDWEEDGERAFDVLRAIDYVEGLRSVDRSRIIVTGLSMGAEVATWAAALDPRIAMAIPAGFSPDLSVLLFHGSHGCWQWKHADIREYVDTADLHALIAPRALLVETGKVDWSFSWLLEPFAADKQVMRASRAAYLDAPEQIIHYLHYDKHRYHVGSPNGAMEAEVRVPVLDAPPAPDSLDWQRDGETMGLGEDLFDTIARLVP